MDHKSSEELKKLGNDCMKESKYFEAAIYYTHALKKDPQNHLILSNRSLAFLKTDQYYSALQDANSVIRLHPDWPKGYFRRGEVETKTEHFKEAVQSYKCALSIDPTDKGLQDALNKATKAYKEQRTKELRVPWIGTGLGVFVGLVIVVGDEVATDSPAIPYMIVKVFLVLALAAMGYGMAVAYRYFARSTRSSLLDEPVDIFGEEDGSSSNGEPEETANVRVRPRGRATSGKQRYKQGKSS